jgi:Lrp/AsnC family leucine-responsive transcriptional regulator
MRILQELNLNARMPIQDISRKVGLSAKQVSFRIKRLEERKVIVGYRTMFDLEKLGYLHYHINMKVKNLTKEKETEFMAFSFNHPNILYTHYSICGPDLEIDAEVENVEKLRELVTEIKDRFASIMQEYEILHYLEQPKYVYMPSE